MPLAACPQVGLGRAEHQGKLRQGQPRGSEHHSDRNSVGPPAPNDLVRKIHREARPYTPEQKGLLGPGQAQQLRHPDAHPHMELVGRADTIMRVTV